MPCIFGPLTAAVLFAMHDSYYKEMQAEGFALDVYDIDRDARTYTGTLPVIAHPPCRAWGQLSHMANPRHDEKELALFAVDMVRKNGGVLEHPKKSKLWPAKNLPLPNQIDEFGGWTLPIYQCNFGHVAEKETYLYIVGIKPEEMPPMPIVQGTSACTISTSGRRKDGSRLMPGDYGYRPECSKYLREHTPPALAHYLVSIAKLIKPTGAN